MDEMESKLGAILSNPDMMQKIMSIAQTFHTPDATPKSDPPQQQTAGFPDVDISTIQRIASFAKQSGIDKNQQSLLRALGPYLSAPRISKLERAMRAAKMANMASAFLSQSQLHFGR